MRIRLKAVVLVLAVGALGFAGLHLAGRTLPGPSLLFNGWGLAPVGDSVPVGDMPLKLVLSPDGRQAVTATIGFAGVHLTTIDVATRKSIQDLRVDRVWNGLAFSPDGKTLYAGGGNTGKLTAYDYDAGHLTRRMGAELPRGSFVAGVAVDPTTGRVWVCDEAKARVVAFDPDGLKIVATVPTGPNPHSCLFGADRQTLYVSNWGGLSVSAIDTKAQARLRDIRVGVRPNDMALAPDGRLFVACAGDNTVHVIQTRTPEKEIEGPTRATRPPEEVREVLNTALEPTPLEGSTPDGVTISPDGKVLYVANADNNDVMVADISDRETTRIAGFIPTGWYPTSVAAVGDQLLVATGKGLHSRPNAPIRADDPKTEGAARFTYIGNTLQGHVSFVPVGDPKRLVDWTAQVRKNTPFRLANVRQTAKGSDSIVPDAVGRTSPIKHILYVIMENRTYDQVFGDLKQGNGDPSLVMYGQKVTPNRHRLAQDYVLLDNLYCNSEVSVDGHAWCDAAIANDANQRDWTSSYAGHGHVTDSDEVQIPNAGYIWDAARRAGLSVKAYGEGESDYLGGHAVSVDSRGTWPRGRDKDRVRGWIDDLHAGEKTGQWADFMIMSLGEDHTTGTRAGTFTPEACVGSNDQAIGKIVEAASHSRFWNSTAIFFIEDDAQNGPDHVDAHRTFGLVVSPWVRRGAVDSTMYSQAGMVRTIELLLGLSPMTQFDAAAPSMSSVFGKSAKAVPYTLLPPGVDLEAKNPARGVGAAESAKMDFSEYDRAPEDELNRVLWAKAKGTDMPYPGTHRIFGH